MFNRNPEKRHRVKYKFVILQVVSMDKSGLEHDSSCLMIPVEALHLTGRILSPLASSLVKP